MSWISYIVCPQTYKDYMRSICLIRRLRLQYMHWECLGTLVDKLSCIGMECANECRLKSPCRKAKGIKNRGLYVMTGIIYEARRCRRVFCKADIVSWDSSIGSDSYVNIQTRLSEIPYFGELEKKSRRTVSRTYVRKQEMSRHPRTKGICYTISSIQTVRCPRTSS